MSIATNLDSIKLFSGSANPELAAAVSEQLQIRLSDCKTGRFSDGEVQVVINENVRGQPIFIIQSTPPPAESLMELVLMVDALRRASAGRITVIVPYFSYTRQDRRVRSERVPISASVVADILTSVGVAHVVTFELHSEQIQGFFNIPVDNLYITNLIADDVRERQGELKDLVVVSPDVGGVVRARAVAKALDGSDLAIVDKRRSAANECEVMHVIGDVRGKTCLIVDDIVDTAGTLCRGAEALKEHGAKRVVAYAAHGLLSGKAAENLKNAALDQLIVTDTLRLPQNVMDMHAGTENIHIISVAPMISEAIRRILKSESVRSMFAD